MMPRAVEASAVLVTHGTASEGPGKRAHSQRGGVPGRGADFLQLVRGALKFSPMSGLSRRRWAFRVTLSVGGPSFEAPATRLVTFQLASTPASSGSDTDLIPDTIAQREVPKALALEPGVSEQELQKGSCSAAKHCPLWGDVYNGNLRSDRPVPEYLYHTRSLVVDRACQALLDHAFFAVWYYQGTVGPVSTHAGLAVSGGFKCVEFGVLCF
ncbi:hypothetical protein PCL_02714 [Purpureocillium lilacinum]|uniref:Uncharacterized protein n=1 Tax=Purpureocillium lilacinum TaxID=33203 RepID=A0A2U3DZX5_PURLI|nr:hypothetical protein PCL_02714 [Purpureocillium lilacinum]